MFILRKIRLSILGLVLGLILTLVGFVAYAQGNATLNLAGFFYGLPLLLGGLALKASEIKPIPFTHPTSAEIIALREQQATVTQNKIRDDVTRYRYGQNAHLDEALEKLGISPSDEELPVLQSIEETAVEGNYTLILNFDSTCVPLEDWQKKQDRIEKFFGPDIRAELTQPQENQVSLALIKVNKDGVLSS